MIDAKTLALMLTAMAATFLPRYLPFLLTGVRFPRALERYLSLVPAAALGALIFPGVIADYPERPIAGLIGVAAAGVYAFFRGGLVIPVLLAFCLTWAGLSLF